MAEFYKTQPTNDPNYMSSSKEPDRIKGDSSYEALFSGIADVTDKAFGVVKTAVTENIKRDARAEMEPIRANHGGEIPHEFIPGIVGTGAKGKARGPALFGGDSDTSVTGTSDATDFSGSRKAGAARSLPAAAEPIVGNLRTIQEAYGAGKLSDAYYYAQLQGGVQRLRTRYPGWEDEIDQAVSAITGVIPANALRKTMLDQLNASATAAATQKNADQVYKDKNNTAIESAFPGYFANPERYPGLDMPTIRQAVADYDSFTANLTRNDLQIKGDATRAGIGATDRANSIVRQTIYGTSNAVSGGSFDKIMQQYEKLAAKGGGDPKELAALSAQIDQLVVKTNNEVHLALTGPNPNLGGKSYASIMNDTSKVESIKKTALDPILKIKESIDNKNFAIAGQVAATIRMSKDTIGQRVIENSPDIAIVGGMDSVGGQAIVNQYMTSNGNKALTEMNKTFVNQEFQRRVLHGISKPISETLGEAKAKGANMAGTATKVMVDNFVQGSTDTKLPVESRTAATKSVLDQTFFAGLPTAQQGNLHLRLGSEEYRKSVEELAKTDPLIWNQYKDFMTYSTGVVFNEKIKTLQSLITDKAYDVKFDPETMEFKVGFTGGPNSLAVSTQQEAQRQAAAVNNSIKILMPIVERDAAGNKDKARVEVMNNLKTFGLDPAAPKENSLLEKAATAVKTYFSKENPDDVLEGRTQTPRPKGKDKFSMEGSGNEPIKEVIGSAEAKGDYNAVYGLGKSTTRDLSQNTVGEIMAMQKHYTDGGSASSAVGKYQFLRKTLAGLVKEGVVSADDAFTPEVQEKLADALLERRGLSKFRRGEISEQDFATELAKEWAGLPTSNGMSFYAGDGLNKAQVRLPKVLQALRDTKLSG